MQGFISFSGPFGLYAALAVVVAALAAWRTFSVRAGLCVALLGTAGLVVAPQFAQFPEALSIVSNLSPAAVIAVIAVAQLQFVFGALSLRCASGAPLGVASLTVGQYAAGFYAKLAPGGVGGWAYDVMFLSRRGVEPSKAAGAVSAKVAITAASNILALAASFAVAVASSSLGIPLPSPTVLLVAVVVLIAGAVTARVLRNHRKVAELREKITEALIHFASVLKNPQQAAPMFFFGLCVVAVQLTTSIGALFVCGWSGSVIGVIPVLLLATAAANSTPAPGGVGATEAAMLAAYAAYGIESSIAISAVALARIASFWVPTPFGGLAAVWCQRNGACGS